MKIGIIGAGQIGGALTRRFSALGHEVFVANSRGPETLTDLAAETGARAVSVPEAVRGVDLVVVTIPQKNVPSLPAGLFADAGERVVVIDTGNYYPRQRDGRIEAIEAGLPESRWVEQQLGRPVVKARSATFTPATCWSWVGLQARPGGSPCRLPATMMRPRPSCCGWSTSSASMASTAGGLDESWRQQPGTPVYAKDFDAAGVRRALAEASRTRDPQWRGTPKSPGTFATPA